MAKNILIAYASKCGSTGEVAEFIGKELCAAGATVDVRRVQEVSDLTGYDAVVVGSAARMGKLLAPARQFVEKRRNALAGIPVAYFTLGTTMIQDTPERRAMAASYLDPLRQIKAPVSEGLFAGKVDPSTMEPLWRFMLSYVKEGEMAPGDHRDWDIIRTWAGDLAGKLIAA